MEKQNKNCFGIRSCFCYNIMFLLFFFIPSKRQYTATFRYEWLGLEEETLHFMERFDMMDLVSYDNLKSLQQEEGFEKIDVDQ